jgi:hypothetical protein
VEAQLRDVAILLVIAVLFWLTIVALRVTQHRGDEGNER